MPARIEGHAKVSGPEMLVNSGKVKTHSMKMFHGVLIGLKSAVAHLAQPKVHSLSSLVSVLTELAPVTVY